MTNVFNRLYQFLNEHHARLSVRRGVLRFSLHVYTTRSNVERVCELMQHWLRDCSSAASRPYDGRAGRGTTK